MNPPSFSRSILCPYRAAILEDLRSLDRRGVRGVFFVDDNITIDVPRFKELCEEITAAGLRIFATSCRRPCTVSPRIPSSPSTFRIGGEWKLQRHHRALADAIVCFTMARSRFATTLALSST
jgi:hypothetical protein